jgi:hypothetical protein
MLALSLKGFRPTTVSTPSSSRSSHPHFSPLSLHSEYSRPGTRTDLVEAAKFLPFILATRHSPLATIPFRIRTSKKRARNSRRIRTSKTKDLKPFRIRTYEKRGWGHILQTKVFPRFI